VDIVELSQP